MKDCDVQVEVPSSVPEDKPEAPLSQVVEVSDMTCPSFRSLWGGGGVSHCIYLQLNRRGKQPGKSAGLITGMISLGINRTLNVKIKHPRSP